MSAAREGAAPGGSSLASGPGAVAGAVNAVDGLPLAEDAGKGGGIDRMRLRSFIGLTLGLVGPRANLAVSGVLLTLLVSSRVSSALAITFALTANRLIGWLAYPMLGRASDRTRTRAGRRAPYMAAGLLIMGVCTWAYTLVGGFWPLVGLIVLTKTASVVFGLTNVAVIPETFGKSRTIKASALIGVLGILVSLVIKGTVIATWKTSHPATWDLAFRMAGGFMVVVAFIVLLLVRESAAARQLVERDRRSRAHAWRDELSTIMRVPNARVLITGIFVFWAGLSATGYLAIVYFQKVQHAGANSQTIAGWVSGVPVVMLGIALGYGLSLVMTRKQIAVLTPLAGAAVSLVQFTTTHIWQSVVLAFVGGPFFAAFVISLAPMLLQLLPRTGGIGELLGKLVAPFSLFAVAFSFLAAWVVDVTGDYRTIWLFPAAAGVIQAVVMCWLRIPEGQERAHFGDLVQRMGDSVVNQVTGSGRPLLGGVVTTEDADAASLFDMARDILGNPYALKPAEIEPGGPDETSPGVTVRSAEEADHPEILATVRDAFSGGGRDPQEEVDIVEGSWANEGAIPAGFELVAVLEGSVVGHVMGATGDLGGHAVVGIAPLAVSSAHQGKGVGTALMTELLARAEASGRPMVVLLGDPAYYGRFGFEPASALSVVYQPVGPDDPHFMVRRFAGHDPTWSGEFRYCWETAPRD